MLHPKHGFLASDCHFASGGGGGGGGGSGSKRTCSITCIYAAPLVPEDSEPGVVEIQQGLQRRQRNRNCDGEN